MNKLTPSLAQHSPSTLEELGREQMRLGRFKDAVETFKQLARRDPRPAWKLLLDQAYVGRARALVAKGMVKEAQIVLENTADAKGVVSEAALYLACLIRQGHFRKATDYCRKALGCSTGEPPGIAEQAAVLELAAPPGAEPALPANAPASLALAAWCSGAPVDEVDRLLQGISLRSATKPLRLILKSLLQTRDDAAKCSGLLGMIPESSAFAGLGRAASMVSRPTYDVQTAWNTLTAAQQCFVAESRGVSSASARAMKDIDEAARRGPEPLLAVLLAQAQHLPRAELRAACLELLPRVPDRLSQIEARCGPLPASEKSRALALNAESRQDWDGVRRHWEKAAEALVAEGQDDGRLGAAIIYRHLADLARKVRDGRSRGSEGDPVARYLELSLDYDPDDAESVLVVLRRHHDAGRINEWTKWVEWAIVRFPDHSVVLEAAVEAAARRNAYKKASSYARRLLALDPINQRARQRMIELRIAHARKQMRSGRTDLALKELTQAGEWERPGSPDPQLGISRALVERRLAPGPKSEAGLQSAVEAAGGGVAGRFRALLEARFMGCSDAEALPLLRGLDLVTKAHHLAKEDVLAVVALLGQQEVIEHKRTAEQAVYWVGPWLAVGARSDWSLEEFQTISETLHNVGGFTVLAAYAKQALIRDGAQPAYRFYEIVARACGDTRQISFRDEAMLDDLRNQAGQRQDFHLVNRIERLLGIGLTGMSGYFEDGDADFDEDDNEFGVPSGDILDALGTSRRQVLALAKTIGVDGAVDHVMKMVSKMEKNHGSPLPLPKVLLKELLRSVIQDELDRGQGADGQQAAGRRRRSSKQQEFEF